MPAVSERVYRWYPHLLSAATNPADVPWPIRFLLGKFNAKHVLVGDKLPQFRIVREDLDNFINQVKWRHFYRKRPKGSKLIPQLRRRTPWCPYAADSSLEFMLQEIRRNVLGHVTAVRRKRRFAARGFSNTSNLVRYALKLLERSNLAASKVDKGHGFAVCHRDEDTAAELTFLQSSKVYVEIFPHDVNLDSLHKQYCMLASRICDAEKHDNLYENLHSQLCRSLYTKGAHHIAVLNKTVKVHKPVGEVTMRPIHAASKFLFAGISFWVVGELRDAMAGLPHMLSDSFAAHKALHGMPCSPTDRLIQIDLKDFFLSGSMKELVADIATLLPRSKRTELVLDAIRFLLINQFVRSRAHPGRLWQCEIGSGMGLPHSGEVADAAFYGGVEQHILTAACMRTHSIKAYVRFRDDILILANGPAHGFFWTMKRFSKYFRLKVVKTAAEVHYLDLRVTVGHSALSATAMLKDTTMAVPLSRSSMHSAGVHNSWVGGMLHRYRRLTNSRSEFRRIVHTLGLRFTNSSMKLVVPQWRPPLVDRTPSIWLPLRFHPGISKLSGIIPKWTELIALYNRAFGTNAQLRVAWKNAAEALHIKIRTACWRNG